MIEKINDFISDMICRVKLITDRKNFAPIFAVSVFAVIIVAFIIGKIAVGSGNSEAEFSTSAAAGFENYTADFKKKGLSVKLRISDIRREDGDTTSLKYQSDYAKKDIIADLIITNRSSREISLKSFYEDSIALASMKNTSSKHSDSDCICTGMVYDKAANSNVRDADIVIGKNETKELTLCFSFPAAYINEINYLLICSPYEEGVGEKWEIAGMGKPYLIFELDNGSLFPAITQGEEEEEAASENVQTTQYVSVYPWTKIEASDGAVSFFNSANSDNYELSLEIAAEGDVRSSTSVVQSGYSAAIDNPAIIGAVPEISCGSEIDRIKVCFKINDSLKENTLGTYAVFSDEFKGIKRFNVFMFMEDTNMLLPIETFHDEASGTVWAETDSAGTYALIDMELWLDSLGVSPSEYNN